MDQIDDRIKKEQEERREQRAHLAKAFELAGLTVEPLKEGHDDRWNLYIHANSPEGWGVGVNGSKNGKATISAIWPRGKDGAYIAEAVYDDNHSGSWERKIGVSLTKSPEQIAADIKRRLLPEIVRVWPFIKARKDNHDNYLERVATTKAALLELPGASDSNNDKTGVWFKVGAFYKVDAQGGSVHFSSASLPLDLALQVLKICQAYQPEHPEA